MSYLRQEEANQKYFKWSELMKRWFVKVGEDSTRCQLKKGNILLQNIKNKIIYTDIST